MADQLIHSPYTKLCHIFPQLLCDKVHEVDHILRLSSEILTKLRILGSHTHRTCVQIADSHHDTSHGYQGCCRKAEFLCTKDRCDSYVTAAHQLTVCLDPYLITKSVHDQRLVCLCKSKLPGKSCIVNGVPRCRTGTAVITGDQDNLCTGLCNTGCNSTNTSLRNQLDTDPCLLVGILQIINQLCQILDRINIVMRRWGDQTYAGC